jgi:hypothetical protein
MKDYAQAAVDELNESDLWPTTPVRGNEEGEHSVNLPLGLAAWFHIHRLTLDDKEYPDNLRGHTMEIDAFPWGRKVFVKATVGAPGQGPATLSVYVKDRDGMHLVYEGQRADELDMGDH